VDGGDFRAASKHAGATTRAGPAKSNRTAAVWLAAEIQARRHYDRWFQLRARRRFKRRGWV